MSTAENQKNERPEKSGMVARYVYHWHYDYEGGMVVNDKYVWSLWQAAQDLDNGTEVAWQERMY